MIVVIDYNMGNIYSVVKMVNKVGYPCVSSSDHDMIQKASCLILPGVGHFKEGMDNLMYTVKDLLDSVVIEDKKPIIGICLGMQLMTNFSEEANISGLGWVDAATRKLTYIAKKRSVVPHMGWNYVRANGDEGHKLLQNMPHNTARFYFAHSYYVVANHLENIALTVNYGEEFCCGFVKNNIIGVQFHPEKSHRYGMYLFKNILSSLICLKEG